MTHIITYMVNSWIQPAHRTVATGCRRSFRHFHPAFITGSGRHRGAARESVSWRCRNHVAIAAGSIWKTLQSIRCSGRVSPLARVLVGLTLGVGTGLFFGEPAGALSIVGDAYIRLLQVTVLPYVLVSLTVGLGGLNAEMARRIGLRGGAMILVLWALTLVTLVCLPLAYPDWTSSAFFSVGRQIISDTWIVFLREGSCSHSRLGRVT